WFALSLGASTASAIVKTGAFEEICSASGIVKLAKSEGGSGHGAPLHGGDNCPLCVSVVSLTLTDSPQLKPSSLEHVLRSIVTAHIAAIAAPPLPSRGPPAQLR
ncbi:MAG: DUF2946 family protein, partial [Betaproteobacteria bacterium]